MTHILSFFWVYQSILVRVKGLEPPCRKALDPKSSTSTNFATPALHITLYTKFIDISIFFEKYC